MEEEQPPIDLAVYVKKLVNCRRKVVVVNSVLNNAHVSLFTYLPLKSPIKCQSAVNVNLNAAAV